MSLNRIQLIGNLTKDAESRQVGDKMVVTFSVATSERYTGRDGQQHEDTEFHNCEYWCNGNILQYLKKGTQVYAEGAIKTDSYTGQDGQQRQTKKIRVRDIQLLGSRQQNAQPQAPAPAPAPAMPQYPQGYQQPQPQYAPQPGYPQAPQYAPQPQMPQPPQYGQQPVPEDMPMF